MRAMQGNVSTPLADGYYLATYLNPVGPYRLADVCFRHDNNVSLWRKSGTLVELVKHWELERITGQKMHRTPFTELADETAFLDRLLAPLGLKLDDMAGVWGTPDLDTADDYHLVDEFPDIAFHSLCHLYSAILMDSDVFFDGTVIGLAVDRGPDRLLDRRFKEHWFAGCVVRRGEVEVFPVDSPGSLYTEARNEFRRREGTLMALATATAAAGSCDRDRVLREYRFDRQDVMVQSAAAFRDILAEVSADYTPDPRFSAEESLASAVMKEVQAISVMLMERNIDRAVERFGIDTAQAHLALAGGYALNCPTNSHLMDKYGFRGLLAPPSVGDDGQSVGLALAAFHKLVPGRFEFRYPGAYLGRESRDLDDALAAFDGFVLGVSDFDEATAVDDLLAGPVVWLDGASEVGPRALGNRSLLGDPTSTAAKDALNRVKRREWWRPVAPVVLEERMGEWFEGSRPSPFMLETFTIRPERRAAIPAVAHLDHSARAQSVSPAQNPALHRLISAFARRTGVPMLCNTSLNDNGEPIIDTIAEAVNFCLRKRLPVAYFNGRRVRFGNFAEYTADGPLPREREPFAEVDDAEARWRGINPHGLSRLEVFLYLLDLELSGREDITTPEGARAVRAELERRFAADPDLRATAERRMRRNAEHFAAYDRQPAV
ncbi:hypothetical protein GCM10023148_46940 [Actinokineospora soli]